MPQIELNSHVKTFVPAKPHILPENHYLLTFLEPRRCKIQGRFDLAGKNPASSSYKESFPLSAAVQECYCWPWLVPSETDKPLCSARANFLHDARPILLVDDLPSSNRHEQSGNESLLHSRLRKHPKYSVTATVFIQEVVKVTGDILFNISKGIMLEQILLNTRLGWCLIPKSSVSCINSLQENLRMWTKVVAQLSFQQIYGNIVIVCDSNFWPPESLGVWVFTNLWGSLAPKFSTVFNS